MQSLTDFVQIWGSGQLNRLNPKILERLNMAAEDKAFLTQAGLPGDAAPFLAFELPTSGDLPTVAEQWGVAKEFQRYRVIGSDGSGSPIALDEKGQGEVVCLDHDNGFVPILMNKSVRQLAWSLVAYRKLVENTQAEFGPDAYLDGKTSVGARKKLRDELTRIDPAAVEPGTFWNRELQNLDANVS